MASALRGEGTVRAGAARRPAGVVGPAPARRTRAFGRVGSGGTRAPGRPLSLRLPIPAEILRRMELGLDLAAAGRDPTGWWGQVEERMHRFVRARLPRGARDLRLSLDEAALEVVVEFAWEDPA